MQLFTTVTPLLETSEIINFAAKNGRPDVSMWFLAHCEWNSTNNLLSKQRFAKVATLLSITRLESDPQMLSHLWVTLSLMKAAPKSHKRECEFWRKHAIVYYCYTLSWNFRDNLVRFWRKSLSLHLKMFQLWAGYNPPKFLVNCYFHSSWTLSWKFKEICWKKVAALMLPSDF